MSPAVSLILATLAAVAFGALAFWSRRNLYGDGAWVVLAVGIVGFLASSVYAVACAVRLA